MGARFPRINILILAAVLVGFMFPQAGQKPSQLHEKTQAAEYLEQITVILSAPEPTVRSSLIGGSEFSLPGYEATGQAGEPALPARTVDIALPPDANLDHVEILIISETSRIMPGKYDFPESVPGQAYRSDGSAVPSSVQPIDTSETVRLISTGQMRKWRFARLLFSPLRYNLDTHTVELVDQAIVEVRFEREPVPDLAAALADGLMDGEAAKRFINIEQAKVWYPAASLTKPTFLIVTTSREVSASTALPDFVDHLKTRGVVPRVITEVDYGPYEPYTEEVLWDIRAWLQQHYLTDHILYVLLIGIPKVLKGSAYGPSLVVPMAHCWPRSNQSSYRDVYTDMLYTDLSGNWDLDGDGQCGEYPDDGGPGGVDFTGEVYVGRINTYWYTGWQAEFDSILRKMINYENEQEHAWRKTALLPMSFTWIDQDNARVGEALREELLEPAGFDVGTLYQHKFAGCTSNFLSTEDLVDGAVANRWKNHPYGWVSWSAHGGFFGTSVQIGYYATDTDCRDGIVLNRDGVRMLDNQHPAFVFAGSCDNGHPETTDSIANLLMRQGGIGVFAAGGTVWGQPIQWEPNHTTGDINSLGFFINQRMLAGEMAGISLAKERSLMGHAWGSDSWQTLMAYMLFGSPITSLLPEARLPQAPMNLASEAGPGQVIMLGWEDWGDNEDGYRIERSQGGEPWIQIADLPAGTTAFLDVGLLPFTVYFYRAAAYNLAGSSEYSQSIEITSSGDRLFLPFVKQ